jgi:hypothetical protein
VQRFDDLHQQYDEEVTPMTLNLSSPLKVVSWASVHPDCPIRYTTTGSGKMTIIFGSGFEEFELSRTGRAPHPGTARR